MKKFLSFALVAMMIVVAAVSVNAVEWVAGDGYDVYSGASYGEATVVEKSPVELTVNEDGSATVAQGGYYKAYTEANGYNNFGGVATAEKVGLNGLEVVVNFDTVPAYTNDCWFGVLLVQEAHPFDTTNMAPTGGWNPLIRFNQPYLEMYSPTFGGLGNSTATDPASPAGMFGLQSGDTLKMNVEYKLGQYYITYTHNDMVYEVPADKTLDASNLLLDQEGKAHVVVTGTLLGDLCDWKYTVSVTEGEGVSEEELANREFEQSKGAAAAEVKTYVGDMANFLAKAKETVGETTNEDVLALVDAIDAVVATSDALVAGIEEAADADAVAAALQAAKDARKVADDNFKSIEDYIATYGEEALTGAAEEEAPAEETAGFPVWVIVVIVVVVVVIAAVALGKKKKN